MESHFQIAHGFRVLLVDALCFFSASMDVNSGAEKGKI